MYSTNFNVSRETLRKLEEYELIVREGNKVQNLFSQSDLASFWNRHILDSLKVRGFIGEKEIIVDIGSGGGVPGVPLAIVSKRTHFILVERREKKAEFLRKVQHRLNLDNVSIVQKNFYEISGINADMFISRGVRLEMGIIEHAKKNSRANGRYIYFSGRNFKKENYPFLDKYETKEKRGLLVIYL